MAVTQRLWPEEVGSCSVLLLTSSDLVVIRLVSQSPSYRYSNVNQSQYRGYT